MTLNFLDRSKFARLETLSQLAIEESQIPAMQDDLNRFFAMAEALKKIDTSGVAPLAHPVAAMQVGPAGKARDAAAIQNENHTPSPSSELALRLQPDAICPPLSHEALFANAPHSEKSLGLFLVPQVIE